jgi:sulfur relay (sulfurtransferase) DsrC/TusE family protein
VATLEILGKALLLDNDGHLANSGEWTDEIARELSRERALLSSHPSTG